MSPGGIYTRDCESCDAAFETRFSRRSHCWECLDATTATPNPRRKGVMETDVEELRRELLLARDAVAKDDEYAPDSASDKHTHTPSESPGSSSTRQTTPRTTPRLRFGGSGLV